MNLLKEGLENHAVMKCETSKKITIANDTQVYTVYKIRLDQLYYNDRNDRIATWITEYKSEHGSMDIDPQNLSEYNSIIQDFITQSNPTALKKTQSNMETAGQLEPGVVLIDGRIIDGNRRFTCLRNIELASGEPQYFEAVIIDRDITKSGKEIKMLELYLQHGVDEKVDYNNIDKLVGIYNDLVVNQLLTPREYARSVNPTSDIKKAENEVKRDIEKAKLMVDYLEFINMPLQFHFARKNNLHDALKELYSMLNNCKDDDEREELKLVLFANLALQPKADMSRYLGRIRKVASNPKLLSGFVEEQMDLVEKLTDIIVEHPVMTEDVFKEKIRGNAELQDNLGRSTEKWNAKVDSDSSRSEPSRLLEKVHVSLESVDIDIFPKLSESQKKEMVEKIDSILQIVSKIRGGLDV